MILLQSSAIIKDANQGGPG